MSAGAMQLGYDVCDSLADAGNFREPLLNDQAIKGDRQRGKIIGRPGVGFGPIRITAAQRGPLRVLAQKLCDLLRIDLGPSNASPRLGISPPSSRAVRP
jgi:hypothetical protein